MEKTLKNKIGYRLAKLLIWVTEFKESMEEKQVNKFNGMYMKPIHLFDEYAEAKAFVEDYENKGDT